MKRKPKILAIVFITALVFAFWIGLGAITAQAAQSGDWTYTDNGVNVTITAYTGIAGSATIPATIAAMPVVAIAPSAFMDNLVLTSMTIPVSVTSIGTYAFSGCLNLTSVSLPANLTAIPDGLFSQCSALTVVAIPAGVTTIGTSAFEFCSLLATVNIPIGVTVIQPYTFSDCTALTGTVIPAGVTSIGIYAFSHTNLTSISVPTGVTSIQEGAFSLNAALISITLPAGITSIGVSAFEYDTNLTSITIPAAVTTIGSYAFNGCSALINATFLGNKPTYDTTVLTLTAPAFIIRYHISNAASWAGYFDYPLQAFCMVTVDLQDGSTPTTLNANVNGGHIATPATPVRSGYTFNGWYKEVAYINLWNFTTASITGDITVYAKWTLTGFTVTFNSVGGSAVTSVGANSGATITAPTPPTKAAYAFAGWYKDALYAAPWTFATDTVSANTTLYARWILLGDLNNDGSITTIDALMTLQAASGRIVLTADQTLAGDVSRDGIVSTIDALKILQYVAGRIIAF